MISCFRENVITLIILIGTNFQLFCLFLKKKNEKKNINMKDRYNCINPTLYLYVFFHSYLNNFRNIILRKADNVSLSIYTFQFNHTPTLTIYASLIYR